MTGRIRAPVTDRANRRAPIDFAHLKRNVSLASVLARYGVPLDNLKRAGSQLRGACPIHNGSNREQFVVNLDSNTWHCFGDCDRGGGVLEFVAAREQRPYSARRGTHRRMVLTRQLPFNSNCSNLKENIT